MSLNLEHETSQTLEPNLGRLFAVAAREWATDSSRQAAASLSCTMKLSNSSFTRSFSVEHIP